LTVRKGKKSANPAKGTDPEKPYRGGRKQGQKMGAYFKPWFRRIVSRNLTDTTAWLWFMKMTPKERMQYLLQVDPQKIEHSGDLLDPLRKSLEEVDEEVLKKVMAFGERGMRKRSTKKK
jgi:hypothetical protein